MRQITNVVLTGSCGGIGRTVAAALLESGASVALVGRDESVLASLVALAPDRARSYTPDVSDTDAMNAVATDWMESFSVPDVVVANAGVANGVDTSVADDLAVMKRMLEINLLGVATTFQPFIVPMREQRRGTLVGIASIAGWRGMPGNGAYAASKGGLIRYLQSLRAELRPYDLTVTTISPGYVKTPLIAGNTMHMPGMIERSEEHTSELQSRPQLVCRLLLEKQKSRGIGAQRARRQFLTHVDHLAHQLEALDPIARAHVAHRLAAPAQVVVVQHVLDQR